MRKLVLVGLALFMLVACGGPKWQPVGQTLHGNLVFLDPSSIRVTQGVKEAWVRVQYQAPVELHKGKATVFMAHARFNCTDQTMATDQVVFYEDEKTGKILIETKDPSAPFGKEPEGSFGDVALKFICKK